MLGAWLGAAGDRSGGTSVHRRVHALASAATGEVLVPGSWFLVLVAADLLWYPVEGRPDISKAPDVMFVLDHPACPRESYKQWEENGRPPNVVFEFISKSNTAGELMDKLEFYSEMGCEEFFIYDYRRGKLSQFQRDGQTPLMQKHAGPDGTFTSRCLEMQFGLDEAGRLWVRRPDGKLMETRREILARAEAAATRAEAEASRAEAEAARAAAANDRAEAEAERVRRLSAKLRELGVDPGAV